MGIKDLLKRRFKIIADYPSNIHKIGSIISNEEVGFIDKIKFYECEKHPHLFKELEWYEERKVEDMPNYLKHTLSDGETTYHKIIKWDGLMAYEDEKQGCNLLLWSKNYNYKPATEEEFLKSQSVSTK